MVDTYHIFFKKEVVFVDIGKLVQDYKLKKELEGRLSGKLMVIKNIIDSLNLAARISPVREKIDSNIERLQGEFQRYYSQGSEQITKEVWDRLNPAIEEYGKKNNYRIIVGANGVGTVLYGAKANDITNELLVYVNQRYEKGN